MRRIGALVLELLNFATRIIVGENILLGGQLLVVEWTALVVVLQPITEAALTEAMAA